MVLLKVNVGDTVAMLPKSRRALTIQEIAALARSSLHGTYPHVCSSAHFVLPSFFSSCLVGLITVGIFSVGIFGDFFFANQS